MIDGRMCVSVHAFVRVSVLTLFNVVITNVISNDKRTGNAFDCLLLDRVITYFAKYLKFEKIQRSAYLLMKTYMISY